MNEPILRPLGDRIFVELNKDEKTPKGTIIPLNSRKPNGRGKVLAVGKGTRNELGELIALEVEVGETVQYEINAGTELEINGTKLLVMREANVICIL